MNRARQDDNERAWFVEGCRNKQVSQEAQVAVFGLREAPFEQALVEALSQSVAVVQAVELDQVDVLPAQIETRSESFPFV